LNFEESYEEGSQDDLGFEDDLELDLDEDLGF